MESWRVPGFCNKYRMAAARREAHAPRYLRSPHRGAGEIFTNETQGSLYSRIKASLRCESLRNPIEQTAQKVDFMPSKVHVSGQAFVVEIIEQESGAQHPPQCCMETPRDLRRDYDRGVCGQQRPTQSVRAGKQQPVGSHYPMRLRDHPMPSAWFHAEHFTGSDHHRACPLSFKQPAAILRPFQNEPRQAAPPGIESANP